MSSPVTPPSCPPPRPNPPPPRGEGPEIGALVKRRLPENRRGHPPRPAQHLLRASLPLGGRVVGDGGRTGGGWHSVAETDNALASPTLRQRTLTRPCLSLQGWKLAQSLLFEGVSGGIHHA